MYIHHTLIAWARSLWSRPQTTSHVVLIRPGGDRRVTKIAKMQQAPRGTGPTKRGLTSEKAHARAEMEQEQSKHDRASE